MIYPKDAGQILAMADIFAGARVVEAGVGSGALSTFLLRAIGDTGSLASYERRQDFADIARKNVERYFGQPHPAWKLTVGDLQDNLVETEVDRIILDMLAPWECLDVAAKALVPGGLICCYVATTTQLSRTVEALRDHGTFTEPQSWETMVRTWHVEGLAVRPDHRMIGHTGFLLTSRRLADGVEPPLRRRRPAKGAYGEDYDNGAPEPSLAERAAAARPPARRTRSSSGTDDQPRRAAPRRRPSAYPPSVVTERRPGADRPPLMCDDAASYVHPAGGGAPWRRTQLSTRRRRAR